MLNLALGALLIGALFTAYQLQNSAQQLPDSPRTTLQAGALSALFIALSALAELLLNQASSDIETLQRMFANLAYYAALPLLASAMLVSTRNQHWQRAAWGRWLIGLFALFELLRRMEQGELYTQIIAVAVSATMLLAALMTKEKALQKANLLAGINMSITLLIAGPGALMPNTLPENSYLYPLLMAATLPLFAIAIKQTVLFHHKTA
ncbi:hypothetical protein [Amphritea japonica]|uniref:Uncharacterized protein n=1 Tax=Amphritea japonica ATCC BAA-1530 TaxID=1278309 RepID=A0A7R6PQH6_9GAMM|nr:hypothetical protein [Amphritea japonica]BBB27658.1 conserved hypothetical protein [Amphritea japonica ATCC BAA-1530]